MTVSGSAGCNTYSGEYSNDINALSFGKVAVTKKMCPGEAMSIETQFLDVLNKTAKMKVEDNDLMLFDASGVEILKAKAQE
jgi:heat shock protein HslJ